MKRNAIIIIVVALATLIAGCNGGGGRKAKPSRGADSLYTGDAAMRIYDKNPHRALELVDSGEAIGNITPAMASFFRARIYSRPGVISNCDTARQICVALLEDTKTKEDLDLQFNVLDLLKSIAYQQGDPEDLIKWATQLKDVCRAQNDETEALRNEAEIGFTLTRLGQRQDGLKRLDRVITSLADKRRFGDCDACIVAMKRKLRALVDGDDMKQAVEVADQMIAKIDDYEAHAADYSDGSFRQPDAGEVAGYCDFYRAQALAFAAFAQASEGNMSQASNYVARFELTSYGHSMEGRYHIAPTWLLLGDYDKVLVVYDEKVKQLGSDTITADYADILKDRATIASRLGHYSAGENYWNRYVQVNKQVTEKVLSSRATSYAARYHAQEQQMEIEKQRNALTRAFILGAMLVLALIFSLSFALYYRRQRALTRAKNRVLVQQIDEALALKSKYEALEAPAQVAEPTAGDPHVGEQDSERDFKAMTHEELFAFLSTTIEKERLFLNPGFGRDTLAERFGLTNMQIGAAFSQGSSYSSLPDFVRELRLEHACRLLRECPEMSVSDVAIASGFTSHSVFGRDFKQKFTLSPTAYRNRGN